MFSRIACILHNFQAILHLLLLHRHSHSKGLMFKLSLFLKSRLKLRLATVVERFEEHNHCLRNKVETCKQLNLFKKKASKCYTMPGQIIDLKLSCHVSVSTATRLWCQWSTAATAAADALPATATAAALAST